MEETNNNKNTKTRQQEKQQEKQQQQSTTTINNNQQQQSTTTINNSNQQQQSTTEQRQQKGKKQNNTKNQKPKTKIKTKHVTHERTSSSFANIYLVIQIYYNSVQHFKSHGSAISFSRRDNDEAVDKAFIAEYSRTKCFCNGNIRWSTFCNSHTRRHDLLARVTDFLHFIWTICRIAETAFCPFYQAT